MRTSRANPPASDPPAEILVNDTLVKLDDAAFLQRDFF